MRYDIRFSGSGGQGIITAGILLAQTASIKGGKNAVQSQSYGPEARGGASKAEVIISDDEINYPKIVSPDVLVSLTQEAYDKYVTDLKDGAIVIVDTTTVHDYDNIRHKAYNVPVIGEVTKELGSAVSANIAILGAVNEICSIVKHEWLLDIVINNFPARAAENNKKAYNIGIELAKKVLENSINE